MKTILLKSLIILTFLVLGIGNSFAQTFEKGTKVVQVGVALGGFGSGLSLSGGSKVGTPTINLAYDQCIKMDLGPGHLGIGAAVGFKATTYKYDAIDERVTQTWIAIAPRATYHPTFINIEKLDAYAGISVGAFLSNTQYSDNSIGNVSGSSLFWGVFIGARYYFTDKLGAYLELGNGLGFGNVGIAFKL